MNSFKLKLIASLFIILDSICYYFDGILPLWTRLITKFAIPLFVYFIVEGFFDIRKREGFYNIKSRTVYLERLAIFAIIMLIGNMIINYVFNNASDFKGVYTIYSLLEGHNLFLTLCYSFAIICIIDSSKGKKFSEKLLISIVSIGLSFICLIFEDGFYLLPITLIFYFFNGNKKKQCIGISVLSALLFAFQICLFKSIKTNLSLYEMLCINSEFMIILCIPFILAYNGDKGPDNKFNKYLFSFIYPSHLWILMILSYVINK